MTRIDLQTDRLPAPTREAGLARLAAHAPLLGRAYAARRNHDHGPQDRGVVSGLSAHIRHRLLLEEELVRAAVEAHGHQAAEKFVQEVCWRTYWKGWLEMRPAVWTRYCDERDAMIARLDRDTALRGRYEVALAGRTGLGCFDAWVDELLTTGYLHNHARMWFASIWVHTLKLPWTLGADLFLRHLCDGDAASNTLSWRWVCGLHTAGKTYLARAANIAEFTGWRLTPAGSSLASEAPPLIEGMPVPEPVPPRHADVPEPSLPGLILLHDEDLHPESWGLAALNVRAVAGYTNTRARSPLTAGMVATRFSDAALADGLARARTLTGLKGETASDPASLVDLARASGARQIVTMRPSVGPLRDELDAARPVLAAAGLALVELRRDWDIAFYPQASRGFFKLRKVIPKVLSQLGIA